MHACTMTCAANGPVRLGTKLASNLACVAATGRLFGSVVSLGFNLRAEHRV